jgi:hypothetical protein
MQNGTPVVTEPFTASGTVSFTLGVSIAASPGDVFTAFIQTTSLSDVAVAWDSILVEAGASVTWAFDTDLPAGTYCSFRVL